MPSQRHYHHTQAMHDLSQDRAGARLTSEQRIAAFRARAYADFAAKKLRTASGTRPLVVAGRYDRAAIMAAAITAAQSRRRVTGEAWGLCLSAALRGVWTVAKAARLRGAH